MRRCRWQGLRAAAVALLPWEGQGRPKCALPGPPFACPKCALETSEDSSQSPRRSWWGRARRAKRRFPFQRSRTSPARPPLLTERHMSFITWARPDSGEGAGSPVPVARSPCQHAGRPGARCPFGERRGREAGGRGPGRGRPRPSPAGAGGRPTPPARCLSRE